MQQIRQEIDAVKASFEARMQALERRLAALQPDAAMPAPLTATSGAAPPEPTYAAEPTVSVILNGSYANLQHDSATYRLQGFIPSGDDAGPGARGFSLGESEIGLVASIDPQYSGQLTCSLTSDDKIS